VLGLLAIKPEHQHAIADRGALQVRHFMRLLHWNAAAACHSMHPATSSCFTIQLLRGICFHWMLLDRSQVVLSPDSKTHACSCFDMVTAAHCMFFTPRAFHLPRPGEPAEAARVHPALAWPLT